MNMMTTSASVSSLVLEVNGDFLPPLPDLERDCLLRISLHERRLQAGWARAAVRLLIDSGTHLSRFNTAEKCIPTLKGIEMPFWIDRTPAPVMRGAGPNICFSLAHQGSLVMAAVADKPLGCDIVSSVPADEIFMQCHYTDTERQWIAEVADEPTLVQWRAKILWGIKEAVFKATAETSFVALDIAIDDPSHLPSNPAGEYTCFCRSLGKLWAITITVFLSYVIITACLGRPL